MTHRHAICLVVDGLRASALGTYGNTTYPTPHLDTLASRAVVADWFYADSPHLAGFYRSVWQNRHAMRPAMCSKSSGERKTVLDQLQQAGVLQWLVTDEPWLIEQSSQLPFDEALLFENEAEHAAVGLEDTTLGRFFSEAIEHLHQWREEVADTSSLTWLHCRGFYGPWDAPLKLRERLLDEEDPIFEDFVQPPKELRGVEDPDLLLSYRVAYAAQVAVLDACVGAFVKAVEAEFAGSETLFMLTSSRGFALGEHGSVGTDCVELFGERMHLPWLIAPSSVGGPLPRCLSLSQPADIGATLLDWLNADLEGALISNEEISSDATSSDATSNGAISGDTASGDGISCLPILQGKKCEPRQVSVLSGDHGELAIRTPDWLLRQTLSETDLEPTNMLYAKPDDCWEKNEVAKLCPEVVEEMQQELALWKQSCQEWKPLPREPQESLRLKRGAFS